MVKVLLAQARFQVLTCGMYKHVWGHITPNHGNQTAKTWTTKWQQLGLRSGK